MNLDALKDSRGLIIGVHPEMPESVYRGIDGISQSRLKKMALSPAHFKAADEEEDEFTSKEALDIGLLTEDLLFFPGKPIEEREKFFVAKEGFDARKKADREEKQAALEAGKTFVTPSILERSTGIVKAVQDHPDAASLLGACTQRQVPCFSQYSGIQTKILIDLLPPKQALVDFKTTSIGFAHPDRWPKQVANMGHDVQGAFYVDVWREITGEDREFWHIVVENEPPYAILVRPLSESFLEVGRAKYTKWLAQYIECQRTGEWYGYPLLKEVGVQPVQPPRWEQKIWTDESTYNESMI